MDSVRSGPFGQIFRPDNFVFGQSGAGNYDCEHVVFKDCSPSSLVEVSVKKAGQVHYIKVVLANNKYELELPKQIRSSRSTPAVIKVNGEQKVIKWKVGIIWKMNLLS